MNHPSIDRSMIDGREQIKPGNIAAIYLATSCAYCLVCITVQMWPVCGDLSIYLSN